MEHMRPPNVRANWHALLEEVSREKVAMGSNAMILKHTVKLIVPVVCSSWLYVLSEGRHA